MSYNGVEWNSRVAVDYLPQYHKAFMENLSLPPVRLDVVTDTLKISQQVAKECDDKYAIVHNDLAVTKQAM